MREIKFRAWDKLQSEMLEWNEKNFSNNDFTYDIDTWTALRLSIKDLTKPRYELMQFTGLQDKNGKEIYEGDIVNMPNEFGCIYPCKIEFRDGSFVDHYYHRSIGFHSKTHTREIIGNIYENPELLEVKS